MEKRGEDIFKMIALDVQILVCIKFNKKYLKKLQGNHLYEFMTTSDRGINVFRGLLEAQVLEKLFGLN